MKKFKTCVMPALEYAVGLWGAGQYHSSAWKQVEIFWRYIARCILGVHQRAPDGGVYGDLGWHAFRIRAAKQATSLFTRITKMPEGLLRKAMHVQRSLVAQNKQCWLSLYKDTICEFPSGSDIWAKWWSEHDFRCDCRIVNEGICHTQTSESQTYTPWEEVLDSAIIQLFKDTWKADVARI